MSRPIYNWEIVKANMTDQEKDRILCIYFNSDMTAIASSVDWEKATKDYGSASIDSMKVSLRNTIKKITVRGGVVGEGDAEMGGAEAETPAKKKKKKKKGTPGRKRKVTAEEGDEAAAAPKKRARGRPSKVKKEHTPISEAASTAEVEKNGNVKAEDVDEE